jgi:hypothetical protein
LHWFEIVDRFSVREDDILADFRDRTSALSFLRGFRHEYFGMKRLRDILARDSLGSHLYSFSDNEILEQIAWGLVSGRLKVVVAEDEIHGSARALSPEIETPPPMPPRPEPSPPPRSAPREEPVSLVAVAQAETLLQAATEGSPFCES